MKTIQILSEQNNIRLTLNIDNAGKTYHVTTLGRNNIWYCRGKFKTTKNGFKDALLLYYRLQIAETNAGLLMDIDNDFYNNL